MTVSINGTSGIVNDATDLNYTGTLTGGTGVVNLGSGQVYKDASGNVGIGTASPIVKLDVVTTSGTSYVRTYNGTIDFYSGVQPLQGGAVVGTVSNHPVTFFANGAERVRIDSSGNLLVGETAVDSSGGFAVVPSTSASGAPAILAFNKGNSASETCLRFKFQGTQVGSIAYSNTATTYATSSDYRLKEAIAPMTGALAKVALLKPCTYKWKVDGSDGQGFIAHELAEVEPGCVTGEKDAVDADGNPQYQGIDTSFLVATLAAAIQELKAIVDAQAARITALEGTAA